MELKKEEKEFLLKSARNAIESLFSDQVDEPEEVDFEKFPALKMNAGAFVTLTKHFSLRGCIGYIFSEEPLYYTVCSAAIQAAFKDPRFRPLQQIEMSDINIEISVLYPPFKMNSYEEIEIGRHGLILEDLGRRALLLPQVPVEHKMNKSQFLGAICEKAGLPRDTWQKRELNMSLFTAEVFSEEETRSN